MRLAPPAALRPLAGDLFGDRVAVAEEYAHLLVTDGAEQGLIGPREVDRIWERHLMNCALMVRALAPAGEAGERSTLADIGSGAGLPGLVLAIARPDLDITLIETMQRRATFLTNAADALGLDNVRVLRARAEDLHGREEFDVVTARAVAALDKLARWSLPLVKVGGQLVAMKGQSAPEEVEAAQAVISRLGGSQARVEQFAAEGVEVPTTVVRVAVTQRPPTTAKKGPRRGR